MKKLKRTTIIIICAIIALIFFALILVFLSLGKNSGSFTSLSLPSSEEMQQRGHVELISQESNRATYLNKDGTKSLYLFSSPVFTDDGKEIDHSITEIQDQELKNRGFTYQNTCNSVSAYFPDSLEDRYFLLADKSTQLKVSVKGNKNGGQSVDRITTVWGRETDALTYRSTAGHDPLYAYPSQFGFTLEASAQPERAHEFYISLDHCIADASSPEYIIFRHKKTEKVLAIAYAPVMRTKDGGIAIGNISVSETNGSTYTIRSGFDALSSGDFPDENARCAVSIHLYVPKQPDTTVYENTPEVNNYLSQFMFTGRQNERGQSQTYVRFEQLDSLDLAGKDIVSASYYVHSMDPSSKTALAAYPAVDDWCSFAVDWTIKARPDPSIRVKPKVLDSGDLAFDITKFVRLWLDNRGDDNAVYSVRNGMVLINSDPSSREVLAANDSGIYGTVLVINYK